MQHRDVSWARPSLRQASPDNAPAYRWPSAVSGIEPERSATMTDSASRPAQSPNWLKTSAPHNSRKSRFSIGKVRPKKTRSQRSAGIAASRIAANFYS